MDKKGQTLALFIIFIPIILALAAIVVDVGLVMAESSHVKEVAKSIIIDTFNKTIEEDDIKDLFIKNDIDVTNLSVSITTDTITITDNYTIDSIFGNIIGIKSYDIKLDITGVYENENITFE